MSAEARSLTRQAIAYGQSFQLPEGPLIQVSGVGSNKARRAALNLLEKGARALASWGSAGGLTVTLSPGALILPQRVLAANGAVYPADPEWHERLRKHLSVYIDLHIGPLAESPAILKRSSEKMALFDRTGSIAVDMESAAIAAVAHEANVPFVAIRVIADPSDMTIPESVLSAVDDFGRLRPLRLLREVARRPINGFALIRLTRVFQAAHASLAAVARLTGNRLLVV